MLGDKKIFSVKIEGRTLHFTLVLKLKLYSGRLEKKHHLILLYKTLNKINSKAEQTWARVYLN